MLTVPFPAPWAAAPRKPSRRPQALVAPGFALLLLAAPAARAEDPAASATQVEPGFFTGLFGSSRSTLLGPVGGVRPALARYGVTVGLTEASEVFANLKGGVERGAGYGGVATLTIGIDADKAFGLEGGSFNVSVLNIRGRNFSSDKLANLQTASGNEADPTTRLWEAWYQQALFGDHATLRLGQQSIDTEFMANKYSALFLNTVLGWPMIPSADLYAGGPASPLSSLGARLDAKLSKQLTLRGGVFDDNPPGGPFYEDSALRGRERRGLRFNLNTGALFIGEVQYDINQPADGEMTAPVDSSGLPGTYKLGLWYDTARFPDQRFDNTGQSLADPASTGIAGSHRGNFSLYAVIDQAVWRPDPDSGQTFAVFARAMGAPGNRNLIDFSINAGINLIAPFDSRPDDTFGIGYGLAKVSDRARDLDRDSNLFNGTAAPVRSTEHFIEVTYQYQVAPWWQVQPDFQYVFNPGAGIVNPNDASRKLKDEAIVGVRTTIAF